MPFPTLDTEVSYITTEQMMEVDRLMIEQYQIKLIQMMENAGRCLALVAKERFLDNNLAGKQVVVLAGTGGNGGGAMVAARRLAAWGATVCVYITSVKRPTEIPKHQYSILQHMKLPIHAWSEEENALPKSIDLILDGIIGYSLSGNPQGNARAMIEWINQSEAAVLSLDTPSGIDLTEGKNYQPTVQANATLTLALPKQGLKEDSLRSYIGELYLGDISVPPVLYTEPSLDLSVSPELFTRRDIVRIY